MKVAADSPLKLNQFGKYILGLCSPKIGVVSSKLSTISKCSHTILETCNIYNFRIFLKLSQLLKFLDYIDLLYVKLMEIISGSSRTFQILATVSRSWDISSGVMEFFFVTLLTKWMPPKYEENSEHTQDPKQYRRIT